ncbi:serine/threonine-protein kinase [Gulosibacter molinativorax]|uniref:RNA-binding protein n=1 Tax=Gulosibacter molinativorax TaxID=256821 RepID=A0ABT7C7W1_9MICO|nr:hypothetical protein [Gulosibacter molinativorax]MDJ1371269.1 RNA-binding protein [Gulosibacter molinativorax]QUY63671.1 Hypotetical protein [Gulosibacter molinativorax]
MGLNHPEDLDAWRRWQRSQNRLRALRAAFRKPAPADLVLLRESDKPTALFALDATTPSALAAVLEPASHLPASSYAILVPRSVAIEILQRQHLPVTDRATDGEEWTMQAVEETAGAPDALAEVRVVVSAGHFLAAGAVAQRWATTLGAPYCVVQHGLLTPFAPPLPREAWLFAFSEADGEFWRSGRTDIHVESVGSQMLWNAASAPTPTEVVADARPVFLGQLHGAELPRRVSARTAATFCRETGATYRPHPAEVDRLSRWQHQRWRRQGIDVEDTGKPLVSGRPIVAIFSTGILEAAAAGMPAWVTCANPPEWVEEFWHRYGLSQWGNDPTPPPVQPEVSPSQQIANRLQEMGVK